MLGKFLSYAPILQFLRREAPPGAVVLEVGGAGNLGFFHPSTMVGADLSFPGRVPPSLIAVAAAPGSLPFLDAVAHVVVAADLGPAECEEDLDGALAELLRVSAEWVVAGCSPREAAILRELAAAGGLWEFSSEVGSNDLWSRAVAESAALPAARDEFLCSLAEGRAHWETLAGAMLFGGGERSLCLLRRSAPQPALLEPAPQESDLDPVRRAQWLAPALRCAACGAEGLAAGETPAQPLACLACGASFGSGPRGEFNLRRPAPASDRVSVSIVIPAYGREALLGKCLESIFRHGTGVSFEVIVVDNASPAGLDAVLAPFHGRVKVLRNEVNAGFARACNQGAAAATGDYVLFLNNDTEAHAGFLEPLKAALDRDPGVAAAGGLLLYPQGRVQHAGVAICHDRSGRAAVHAYHIYNGEDAGAPHVRRPREMQAVTAACMMVRRDVFDMLDGFDPAYWNGLEDVDFCLRLRESGFRIRYEPGSVLTHHESVAGPERWSGVMRNLERFDGRWGRLAEADDARICLQDGMLAQWVSTSHGPDRQAVKVPLTSVVLNALGMSADQVAEWLAAWTGPVGLPLERVVVRAETDPDPTSAGDPDELLKWVFVDGSRGPAHAMNAGLRAAAGCSLVCAAPGVVPAGAWMEEVLTALHRLPGSGAACVPLAGSGFHPGAVCLKREAWERLGDMDEDMESAFWTDDFLLRIVASGGRVESLTPEYFQLPPHGRASGARESFLRKWGVEPCDVFQKGHHPLRRVPEGPEAGREDVRSALEASRVDWQSGDVAGASEWAERAAGMDPTQPEAWLLVGITCARRGHAGQAMEALKLAARLAPHHARYVLPYADLLRGSGQASEALEHYQRLLALRPRDAALLTGLGDCLAAMGEAGMARECLALAHALRAKLGDIGPGAPAANDTGTGEAHAA